MQDNSRSHPILSPQELKAMTEGLLASERTVAVASPLVEDHELFGRIFLKRGYESIPVHDPVSLVALLQEKKLVAVVLAEEFIGNHPDIPADIRRRRPDLPVYLVCADVDNPPQQLSPPFGLWNRDLLEESAAIHFSPVEAVEDEPGDTGGDGEKNGDLHTRLLETLVEPVYDIRQLIVCALDLFAETLKPAASGALLLHGGFFLEVRSASAHLRTQAGNWILGSGPGLWRTPVPKTSSGDSFPAIEAVPLLWEGHHLGFLFFFWTEPSRSRSILDRTAECMAARMWELLERRAAPGGSALSWDRMTQLLEKKTRGVLLLAAPFSEERIQELLGEEDRWCREPGGAYLCFFPSETIDSVESRLFLPEHSGAAFFAAPLQAVSDPVSWVRTHSETLADMRLSGRTGFYRTRPSS